MKTTSKFGFILVGLLIGIVAAQALPLMAHGTGGAMMGHGFMHRMGAGHMKAMHGMMDPDAPCPMSHTAAMFEACREVLKDQVHLEQCEALMETGQHSPESCPFFTGIGAEN